MQGNAHKQQGLTFVGLVVVLALIGFAALVAMRLVPVYMEAYTVASVLENLGAQTRLDGGRRSEVRDTFERRLSINDVDSVTGSDLNFTEVSGGTRMDVEYETRRPLIGNLDIVAHFHKTAVLRN